MHKALQLAQLTDEEETNSANLDDFVGQHGDNIASLGADEPLTLPDSYRWQNDDGSVEYSPHFFEALDDLGSEERRLVILHVRILAEEGWDRPSLHTHKYYQAPSFSPEGCEVSRGSKHLRFSWTKNGSITVHWLFRKKS